MDILKTRVISLACFLAIWSIVSNLASSLVLPGPDQVVGGLVGMVVDGQLAGALATTLTTLLAGGAMALVLGIPLGLMMGAKARLGRALDPLLSALYVMPFAAVAPLFVLWFGIDATARIIFIFLFTFPQIAIVCYHGAQSTPRRLLEVGRAFGASERDLFFKAILPHELPFVFTALRLGVGRGLQGMVVAELVITAIGGVGYLIKVNSAALDLATVLALIISLTMVGVGLTLLVDRIEAILVPWSHRAVPQDKSDGWLTSTH